MATRASQASTSTSPARASVSFLPPPPALASSTNSKRATFSPKTTTFTLPPAHSAPPSPTPPTRPSFLSSLSRKLSVSRSTLVRRVSLGSKGAVSGTVLARAVSKPEPTRVEPVEVGEGVVAVQETSGLRRGLRALGRSKSEGRVRSRVVVGEEVVVELGWKSGRETEVGDSRLFWEERLGVCWDGREQVLPDLPTHAIYSSNSDTLPPSSRVVFASTLSTFPPRPPLVPRLSSPLSSPALPLSPASQVMFDYLDACRQRESLLSLDSDSDPTTPQAARTPVQHPFLGKRHGYASSAVSDSSSTSLPSSDQRQSEESNTSLESLREERERRDASALSTKQSAKTLVPSTKAGMPTMKFSLVDGGPVPPSSRSGEEAGAGDKDAVGRKEWTTFTALEDGEGSPVAERDTWWDCD